MGQYWDGAKTAYNVELWAEALRIIKPGGHLVAFGATRTWHRLACAIEDAGWDIRDCIMWLHGQGFPKSRNISKALDKMAGAEREEVWADRYHDGRNRQAQGEEHMDADIFEGAHGNGNMVSIPSTDEAKEWDGWGTGLKPGYEPIILARKPFKGTVAANVLKHGTGALNIDATRLGNDPITINTFDNGAKPFGDAVGEAYTSRESRGRWPANVVLSHLDECQRLGVKKVKNPSGSITGNEPSKPGQHVYGEYNQREPFEKHGTDGLEEVIEYDCSPACPVAILDRISGKTKSATKASSVKSASKYRLGKNITQGPIHHDEGGASRFYYTSKAAPKERNLGLPDGDKNEHPTVKPLAIMRWLVKMVNPPGGTVYDPFTGSGTTGMAVILEGGIFVGTEQDKESYEVAKQRIEWAHLQGRPPTT